MMKGHGPVQPDWGNPNHGRRVTHPDDPFDGCQGLRATVDREKGTGGAPTLAGVAWPKAVVDLQGQPPGDGGTGLHSDRDDGGDVGQRLHVGAQ
jgi:hypothetical protein